MHTCIGIIHLDQTKLAPWFIYRFLYGHMPNRLFCSLTSSVLSSQFFRVK